MNTAEPTRQIYWNITHIWIMYLLLVPTLAVGGYGIFRRARGWRGGLDAKRFDRPGARFKRLIQQSVEQRKTFENVYAGFYHQFISYGFVVLAIATTVVAIDVDLQIPIMRGSFYLYFQSFIVDLFGALVISGIAMAAARRYLRRPPKIVYSNEATLILCAIALICLQGFLIEGWRIAVTNDPWGVWSPFGNLIALASRRMMSTSTMQSAHLFTWWLHLAVSFAFLAWLPYTKLIHTLTAPLNIYTSNLEPIGASLKNIDFETTETFGVNKFEKFTWKDLLDFDACTECGRCTSVCPANTVGKELSPRDIIIQLRDLRREDIQIPNSGLQAEKLHTNSNDVFATTGQSAVRNVESGIIGSTPATSRAALWQCTTCAACMEACPVLIEQMPKIVDMRRYLVMEEAEFPETMQAAIMSLEKRGHPFSGTQATRMDWADGLGIKLIAEEKDTEVLLWAGCGGSLVERNQSVTRSTAKLLQRAGVKFAIMGREEKCSGDPARRIGNEFLFESLAKENVANLEKHRVTKIITSCPHCFNTFKNEYPQYGGKFEVFHHSEYLSQLVSEGRLKPATKSAEKVTFHDPCYLGRQNGVFGAPRQLVQISTNVKLIEMERTRARSFCCGGGGGMSFVDEPATQRVNQERAREAVDTGADVLAVGCPFCMTMMEDGIKATPGSKMRVMDVAELLLQATEITANTN